jgi:hypothetical protein
VPGRSGGGFGGTGGAVGVAIGAAIVDVILQFVIQRYVQDILDEKNAEAFRRDLTGQQGRITTLIAAQQATIDQLKAHGTPTFVNITLHVRYQTDVTGQLGGGTAYMGLDVRSVQITDSRIDKVIVSEASRSMGSVFKEVYLGSSERLISFSLSYPGLEMASKEDPPPKGGCFIATACYGSAESPEVVVLRGFRDQVLQASAAGRVFIAAYYRVSPPIAATLRRHQLLRFVVRTVVVTPLASAAAARIERSRRR